MSKKSQKELRKELIKSFKEAIIEASNAYGVPTSDVTKAQYNDFSEISDWDLRKIGGFAGQKKLHFPSDDKEIDLVRSDQKTRNYIAKLERDLGDKLSLENEIREAIVEKIKPVKINSYKASKSRKVKTNRDVVAMLNDTHIGLEVKPDEVDGLNEFNFKVASRRIGFFIDEVCNYKKDKRAEVDTLHLALNGDLIAGIIHGLMGRDNHLLTYQFNAAVHTFSSAIARVAENYKKVKVYFSTGNHGDLPHRREGGRVSSQVYDSIEGQIFYALSIAHSKTKNVEFIAGKSLHQDMHLPGGRAIITHGHLMFSRQLGNPGTSVNVKALGEAIADFNTAERRAGREEVKLVLLGHTHTHFHITTKHGVQVFNAPSLSGIDSYALSLGIRHNFVGQCIFESTKDYIFGDSRLIQVSEADSQAKYDKIIKPYDYELTHKGE